MHHLHIILSDNSQIREGDSTIIFFFFQLSIYGNDDFIQFLSSEMKLNQKQDVLGHIRNKLSKLSISAYIGIMRSFFFIFKRTRGAFFSDSSLKP